MITVIGLGNVKGDLTRRGEEEILKAAREGRKIAVRTANTLSYQTVQELNVPHVCLDEVYDRSRNFATLSKNLAKAVLSLGEDTVYLVDGATGEDNSVKALLKSARGKIQIIEGVSKITPLLSAVRFLILLSPSLSS